MGGRGHESITRGVSPKAYSKEVCLFPLVARVLKNFFQVQHYKKQKQQIALTNAIDGNITLHVYVLGKLKYFTSLDFPQIRGFPFQKATSWGPRSCKVDII